MNEQDKYLPYLKEIQRKIIILCFTTLGFSLIGFFYYQKIIGFILGLFKFDGITMVLTSPYQFFDLAINTGIATGVIVAFPLLIYFLISFLRPALDKTEFKHLLSMVPAAFVLFVIGFGFGIYVMQFVISIFSETANSFNVGNIWDLSQFLSQTISMGVCLGLIFELPIVVSTLIRFNVVSKKSIAQNRRIVYAIIIIIAAFLPPNDIISLSILTIAPLFLFELALLLNH